ncbi:MAG: hypothetical protein TYPL_3910 [Candidatus Tyloplasma litorale]|nr:MAG: hypothetical protein TYPL_3910 [Mycoplasmatales bacterium]
MLRKILLFSTILLISLFSIILIFNTSEKKNLNSTSNSSYNTNKDYSQDSYIDYVEIYPNNNTDAVFVEVHFNDYDYAANHFDDIQIKLAEFEEPITYGGSSSDNEPYLTKTLLLGGDNAIIYTLWNLDLHTTYHMEYISIDDDDNTWNSTNNLSFTVNYYPYVQDIEVVDDSITSNSVQIKARFVSGFIPLQSYINYDDINWNLYLKLEGYDEILSIGNPIGDISLTYDENIYSYSNDINEGDNGIYFEYDFLFTISGLESETEYTIKEAALYYYNGYHDGTNFNLSFTTGISPAVVNSIEIVADSITDSSAQIKVTTSTTNFNADDLALQLAGHDGDLTTSTPIDGITLTHDSTNGTEIIYTISGLTQGTEYTITSAKLNNISTEDINLSFTTAISLAIVNSVEVVTDSITVQSAQIKVTTSTTNFNEDDLALHLAGHDGELTTSTPIDGITLTHDSTNGTEIIYTISGLTQGTQYTIDSVKLNDTETTVDVSFTTKIPLAIINSIEIVNDSITDSSAQIKVTTSTTNFNADDLALQLAGYDGDLTTSTPIDEITLTHDSTNGTEITYTISGLTQGTQYTIVSAELNDTEKVINESFTTAISLAVINSIQVVTDSITDSSAQIKVTTSTTNFNANDLALQLAGHDGDLTTSTPVDGITLTHDSTNGTEIYYTISGLTQGTEYTIVSAELNGTETTVDVSFTTGISPAIVNSIQVVADSVTYSSAQIKVTTSTTNFNADNLILHLAGHDGDLTTSTPVDGITLTHDSINGTEIIYTISGLAQNTQYTITSAELNGTEITVDVSFTTGISPATINSIQVITDSITDSSAQIKVTTSTTNFNVDDLALQLAGHDGDLTTSTPIDEITLTHDSTNGTEITYTISGLAQNTKYTIVSAKLNGNEKVVNESFTTAISLAVVNSIQIVDGSITDSSAQIKVTTSTTNFNADDLVLHFEGHDGDLTISTPVDEITLTHDSTNETEIIYTISGLAQNTQYTITSAKLNGNETTVDVSFTTGITPAVVNSIQVVTDSVTDSSAQIKVTTSTTNFNADNLILHLAGHDGDLTTSTPVDGIILIYDSTSGTEITYTISGLAQNTQYTITSAKLNGNETTVDVSFTTGISPAIVNSIQVITDSITDSSAQIKVTTSTTNFNADDLALHLAGHDGDLTTSNPIDGITLTHDSTSETEITYTISGLAQNTQYTITSAKLNGNETNINTSFTTGISPAIVNSIQVVDGSVTDSSVQIKVTTSTTNFNADNLILHLDGHDGDLTTSNPIDGITLTHDSTSGTEITYTISGLAQNTQYTITSAKLNGNETTVDVSFTTGITLAVVNSIQVVTDSVTNSSVQIKVTTSTTNFNADNLILHLAGHDGDLTTSNPIDGIILTHDSTNETEVYYTISGLTQNTQYTITSAKLNGNETTVDVSFTTGISPAIVNSIQVVTDSITDSSAQIKVTTSTTNFNADDLVLHFEGHDGDLTTSTPVDGITLTHDSTSGTEITYTISGLTQNTQYTITSAKLNGISTNNINLSFTTAISLAIVNTVEVVNDSVTDSSAQIKVTTSTTNFNADDLILHLDGHDGDLTTSTPVDGITLTYDSTNETEIIYTISGLAQNTQYTITSVELNGNETTVDVSFTTGIPSAIVKSIEVVNDSITDSSVQIKVTNSTTNFNADDLALHLADHDGDLTTSTPIDGITLTHDSTSETEVYYTISGLAQGTQYTITSAKLNGNEITVDVSFTTEITLAVVNSIQVITDSVTDSSAQIKVTTSTTNFNTDDLVLHLEGHDGDLTTSNPIDGITLTYDSTNKTEITYTISGLEQETQYTITSAELNGTETTVDVSFTTGIPSATVKSIEVVNDSVTDSSVQIKVTTSTTNFNADDLVLHLEDHDGDLTTSTPVDGITLTHDSTNETEIIYTISGLAQNTQYTITSAKLNGTETTVDVSFTTGITLAVVNSIEVVNDSITDSSAQIKVTTSTTNFNADDLVLHLEGYDGDLTTSTPVDGITLTHDSTDETEIIYTISGLEQNTQYTITSAELNGNEITVDVSFTTGITLAVVNSIEVVNDSITDSSAQIKVTTSTTNFNADNLILHLANHDGDLTTSTPVDGITLTHDSTDETEIIYTISGLEQETQYTITSAELNGTETTVDVSFTTGISPAAVSSIQVITNSVTDSSAQIKVTTSTTNFNADDLVLHLEGHDGDLTTSNPIDGITLTYDSTNETEIYYTISGLESGVTYTITSAKLNGNETTVDVSFTTGISPAIVNSIQVVTDSVTDSSAQIKVTTSTTNFNADDLILHLEGHDGDLTTSTPIDGITLTSLLTDETEIYYTISGLEADTEYTITSAKLNDTETTIDLSFTTAVSLAEINYIEIIEDSITDSSVQFKITTSTTNFDPNDLVLQFAGYDDYLTTSTPVDGITLTYDSTDETEIIYTISGLEANTEYTMISAKINDHELIIAVSFTTTISLATVNNVEIIDGWTTDSSAQIKVTTSTTNFNADDLALQFADHDGDLTTSTPVDGITLTHDSTNGTEIIYTISGLESGTTYTITSAKLNGNETTIDLSFTTYDNFIKDLSFVDVSMKNDSMMQI